MEVKGTAVLTMPLFVKKAFGDESLKRWLDKQTPEARAVLNGAVLATSWYPMKQMLVEPTRVLCDIFYGGQLRGAREAGSFSAEHGLRGIYKIFVRLGSAEALIKKASTILPTYYKPSNMDLIELKKGRAVLRTTEFPEPDETIEARICGWMEKALAISGCKSVVVTTPSSMAKGDSFTEYRIGWL